MRIIRDIEMLHPILEGIINRIESEVILKHNAPFKLFETGRDHERHETLIIKGKTRNPFSRHLYNLENDPPLYATAVDYVYFTDRWSWNIRDSVIRQWYKLFGQLVLETCPELSWAGLDRKSTDYNHFQLRRDIIINNLDKYPCVSP